MPCTVEWWDESDPESLDVREVEVRLAFEGDWLDVYGLRDGYRLSIPLRGIGRAIAEGRMR